MRNVLIFSKSTLYRECLANFINEFDNIGTTIATGDFSDFCSMCDKNCPDFVVADLYSRNNGLDVVGSMLEIIPRSKIIILTTADNRHLSYYESYYGITNFVFADDSLDEIRRAFLSAFAGRCYCDLKNSSALTTRECEILKLIASGKTSKEIADELCISKNTVDTHRNKMLQKLDITNSASLVQFAYRTGLL